MEREEEEEEEEGRREDEQEGRREEGRLCPGPDRQDSELEIVRRPIGGNILSFYKML